ncbi:hypothetical protein CEQ90_15795 [Lewinellaceae bacterium SD302]|nr:hypothetical protein CEQ90_15795 [Lewinellaceae bacterium SD302]
MKYYLLALLCILFGGCYYDVEEELYPSLDCATEGVTYSATVVPLLQDNCYACHDAEANFGGVTLEGYDRLQTYVNNGELLGAIRHTPGFSPMPNNAPQLPGCEIEKIVVWVEAGAPNN